MPKNQIPVKNKRSDISLSSDVLNCWAAGRTGLCCTLCLQSSSLCNLIKWRLFLQALQPLSSKNVIPCLRAGKHIYSVTSIVFLCLVWLQVFDFFPQIPTSFFLFIFHEASTILIHFQSYNFMNSYFMSIQYIYVYLNIHEDISWDDIIPYPHNKEKE